MYRKISQGWLKHWDFILLDMVCLQVSIVIAYMMRHGLHSPYANPSYVELSIVLALADLVILIFTEPMKGVLKRGYAKEAAVTFRHVVLVMLVVSFYLFSTKTGSNFSRIFYYLLIVFYMSASYLMRSMWKAYLRGRKTAFKVNSVFLVTAATNAKSALERLQQSGYGAYRMIGLAVVDADLRGQVIGGVPVKAWREDITESIQKEWVDEVFVMLPREIPCPEGLLEKVAQMGIVTHVSLEGLLQLDGQKQFVEKLVGDLMLTTSMNSVTVGQAFLKRALDIVGGLAGCLATGLLCIVLGPLIYVQSPGPIFFAQERVGRNGRRFRMYKFRSMYPDAEERKQQLVQESGKEEQMMFKLEEDPRIIGSRILPDGSYKKGIGNYIRDWSLDEFPQFFNVLKGDMSLVGTRPPTVDEWEKYELHHRVRLSVKPGITGMWQVSGRSQITDFEEVVELDQKYINSWSMGLDVKILLATVAVVFGRIGAM